MSLENRNLEDIDITDEYEMIPFEPMTYGYGQMNDMQSMGMSPGMERPMGYNQDLTPNTEMNPWMGMNQFSEDMFTNGFSTMSMMYGDGAIKDYEDDNEELRQMDKYGNEEPFKDGPNNLNKFDPKYNDVDYIVRRIERYNPAIFRLMTRCGMPYTQARDIVRRIVKLTLMYREE